MDLLDDLGTRNPRVIKFRQCVSYNARKKISSTTSKKELVCRFDKCWNDFSKVLPQYSCYDQSWLFSQIFNCITRFCDSKQKDELLETLRKKHDVEHLVLKPPRLRKPSTGASKSRRIYSSSSSKKTNRVERKIQTLDETREFSGLDFSYVVSQYGVVLSNTNVLKELSIHLQTV